MRRKLAALVIVLGVLLAGVLGYAATRPDTLRVERSAAINAPAERIAPLIADLHRWTEWSAYETKDPDMKRTYSGANAGVGAVYMWEGDSNVGSGRMEIVEASAAKVRITLDFVSPLEGHNVAEFALEPNGNATNVRWAMDGPSPFIGKLLGVFIDMDKMVGQDFEIGLANLKALAEK
jgi:hypothetical protein